MSSGNSRSSKKGVILFTIIVMLMVIGLIGTTLVASYLAVNTSSRLISNQAKAFYLAESGISYGINLLRNKAGRSHGKKEEIGPISLGEGAFRVELDYDQSLITATGTVQEIEKKLQLKYVEL
ncbi:MAG: hypothetical protein K9M01_04980 [Candidatus Omnitrophica bacterium]|nr:hypothetical protein [Candidatus Omnitrophota bacterium]MCF7888217.1 hypothetical protein [Candidatus Omnitrophota bacterium]